MLTKDDLKAIQGIVKEEVSSSIKKEVSTVVKKELMPIGRRLHKLEKKLDLVIKVFDNEIVDHELRITRMEERTAHNTSFS